MFSSIYLITIVLGICCGIITGLIPGVHINLISSLVLINVSFLLEFFDLQSIAIFIIAMGITHTFVDFIPSVLFGVPSSDTALSVLPAHRLVLDGRGYNAIFLSSMGSLFGMFFCLILIPIFFLFLDSFYEFMKAFIPYILITTIVVAIVCERDLNKIFYAIILNLFCMALGIFTLNARSINDPLLILFTGLFGISSLLLALRDDSSSFPKQSFKIDFKFSFDFFKAVSLGGIASAFCCVTPGIGNAQAGTISTLFFRNITSELFIVLLSAINTINFALSILTLYLISKARNGSIFIISQVVDSISLSDMKLYFLIVIFVGIIAFFITLFLGKNIIKIVNRINIRYVNWGILIFLFLMIFLTNGIIGILILFCACFLGIFCVILNLKRVHLMSILIGAIVLNLI